MNPARNVSLILAHPNKDSFNHAIAGRAADTLRVRGYRVCYHDLYGEKFDPLLPHGEFKADAPIPLEIETHCREVAESGGIVIVHPNWFGQPPAILKGWIDRVLRPGVAYKFLPGDDGGGAGVGLLKARKAIVFNTSDTPEDRENAVFGDPLESIWNRCIFGFCGVKETNRVIFRVVVASSEKQRQAWLAEAESVIARNFPKLSHPPSRQEGKRHHRYAETERLK